jgi:hypothetical protein
MTAEAGISRWKKKGLSSPPGVGDGPEQTSTSSTANLDPGLGLLKVFDGVTSAE